MNIQEKAEQYARNQWGDHTDKECEIAGYDLTYGDISASDYINGYNEAKRWIPFSERLPCDVMQIKTNECNGLQTTEYVLAKSDIDGYKVTRMFKRADDDRFHWVAACKVIEWREI